MKQQELIYKYGWDVLIILDACRYDSFKKVNFIEGDLIAVDSESTRTTRWYQHNWNEYNDDVILISSHSYPRSHGFYKNFYKFYDFYLERDDYREPKIALEKLIEIQNDYDKHFLVHLLPPHLPYLGKKGSKFMRQLKIPIVGRPHVYRHVTKWGRKHGWKKLIGYYKENILYALTEINKYLPQIKGKVIISSDHGELIGERNIYNHYNKHEKIFEIPWLQLTTIYDDF